MKLPKIFLSIGLSGITTLGLFYFMSALISGGQELNKSSDSENFIEFIRVKPMENLETRNRKIPKKPPEPKQPPKMEALKTSTPKPQQKNLLKMDIPNLVSSLALGDGPFIGGVGGGSGVSSDRGVVPLVRVQPQIPRKAAIEGIQGWVKLRFDITEDGSVDNVDIVQAKPPRIFDSSARQALLKWRYRAQLVDGKPKRREGMEVILDFKIEE